MRSSGWRPVAGWCAATAVSIALASAALLPVLRATAPADSALAQLPAAGGFPPSATPSSRPTKTNNPAKPRNTTSPSKTTKPHPVATTPPPTTENGWTVTTGAGGLRTYVRSFRVAGGQAVIRMTSDAVVTLVTATPADGYAVQKVQNSPDNMAVYFNETAHSFIIHATWWDDRPFVQVDEVGK